jgi:tetratricopeptide (TPR) repeat protein
LDLIRIARERFQDGHFEEAERLSRELLRREPDHRMASTILALSLNARGRYADAAALLRRLTQLEPGSAVHWANLGTALRSCGEFDEALAAYHEAAQRGQASADFLLNVGLLHIERFEYGKARAVFEQAAALAPDDAEIRYFHAASCFNDADDARAQEGLRGWRDLKGLSPEMLTRIGTLLTQLGDTVEAEAAFRAALSADPGQALARVGLAQLLERGNRVAEAQREMDGLGGEAMRSPELANDLLAMDARLAERAADHRAAKDKYRLLLERTPVAHQRYHVLFSLARVHDALGEYEEAMSAAQQAHASQVAFLERAAARVLAPGRQAFGIADFSADPADAAAWADPDAPDFAASPIFIVAFPRSGTTLLEQMLDAHPALRSMDEQPFLQYAIDHLGELGATYPERLAGLTPAQLGEVRARYWRYCRAKVSLEPGQRLVDKNPLNLLRLPAIRRLFPRARILLAIRHPCDVLISNFMQHYRAPEIAAMCRSLESLAQGHRRAFDFWYQQQGLLAPEVMELSYESFVADFPAQARRVAEFLELPWNEAMLEPAAHALRRGYISTPSYSQVVQPVSTRAVGRWRNYGRHLRPVLPILDPYLRRWSYDAGAEASANSE